MRLRELPSISSTSTSVRRTVSLHGLLALLGLLGEGDLADHAGLLADLDLLAGAHHLDRLLLEGSLGLLGAQRAVGGPALGPDMLLAQGDGLLHRPLAHAGGDAHAAVGDLALADGELLLDHLHGLLGAGALAALALGSLEALHDRHGPLELLLGHAGGDQRLALAGGLGELASILLAEAMLGDLAHELVALAPQDLDVPVLEALAEEGIDHLAGDLLVVESADDGRCHLVSLHAVVGCRMRRPGWSSGRTTPSVRVVISAAGYVEALHHRLLASQRDMLGCLPGGPPPGDADLLGGPQALLDHHHLLEEGDDRGLTLLPHRDGCFHPAVDRHPFHLDLVGGRGARR